MSDRAVGYSFLHRELSLAVFAPQMPARTSAVLRVIEQHDHLAVPEGVAPVPGATTLDHVLFALKHEGVDLQILSGALRAVPHDIMLAEVNRMPSGAYIRKACFLWEHFNQRELAGAPSVGGANADLFDSERYITQPGTISKKWRVHFNGFGNLNYCPIVRRTSAIKVLLKGDFLDRLNGFVKITDPVMLDRALSWAYLGETEGSFAIERETPSVQKRERFVELLRRAHETRPVDEAYLVELQNAMIDNPHNQAVQFRVEQNRLVNGRTVTYLPPPPDLDAELMEHLMEMANQAPKTANPIIAASLSCFGFVFLHPFMDGNGRISRFLFHKALCDSGSLPSGLLLPISVAIKKHEREYLAALQSFSRIARSFWQVGDLSGGLYDQKFIGSDAIYRYWDATPCVEFAYTMAQEALEQHLLHEVRMLTAHDRIKSEVDDAYDVRGDTLSLLIFASLDHQGRISNNLRRKFVHAVPGEVMDLIEQISHDSLESHVEQKDEATDSHVSSQHLNRETPSC